MKRLISNLQSHQEVQLEELQLEAVSMKRLLSNLQKDMSAVLARPVYVQPTLAREDF